MNYKPQKITGWLRFTNSGKGFKITKSQEETSKPVAIGPIARFNGWFVNLFFKPVKKPEDRRRNIYKLR